MTIKTVRFAATLLAGCAPSAADRDRPVRADSPSLLGQRTDSAIARLVHNGWTLLQFVSPHEQALHDRIGDGDALLVLYSQGDRVCYAHIASDPEVGYDPEWPESLLVLMHEHDSKAAYTKWLGQLVAPHGLPVVSQPDSARWGAIRITHSTKFLHGFVGDAAGCLEPSDDPEIRDK